MRVFISTSSFGVYDSQPLCLLRKRRIAFCLNPHGRKLTKKEIVGFLGSGKYDGLIAGTEPLTAEVLKNARGLKVISRVGIGLDNVDLKAAKQLKIKVFNTPDVLTDSVAELTLGLLLSSLRRIALMDRKIRLGIWNKEMGLLLRDKRVGIIGFGRIGKRVSELASAFGAEIVFYDIRKVKAAIGRRVPLNTLFKSCDIISIHAATKGPIVAAKEIRLMKRGAVLVNTSRGSVIDEAALIRGLNTGKIGFAGLDVFDSEPYYGALVNCDNTVLTAHAGSYAKEARSRMELEAAENLLRGLKR